MRPARGAQAKGLDVPLLDWGGDNVVHYVYKNVEYKLRFKFESVSKF